MNGGGQRSTLQVLLEVTAVLVAIGVQVAGELYLTDADFRYRVDVGARRVRHWIRRRRWEMRWAQMTGWQRELVEQVHGPQ